MARSTARAEQTHVEYETGGVRIGKATYGMGTSVLRTEKVLSRKTDADGSWRLSWGCGIIVLLAGSVLCLLGWMLVICLAWPRMAWHTLLLVVV